jgi:hypothetical protein
VCKIRSLEIKSISISWNSGMWNCICGSKYPSNCIIQKMTIWVIHSQDWYHIINVIRDKSDNWALRTKAVLDRTRLALADKAEYYQRILQPTAEYLGGLLGIEQWAVRTSVSLRSLVHTCMHPFTTSCFIHQT